MRAKREGTFDPTGSNSQGNSFNCGTLLSHAKSVACRSHEVLTMGMGMEEDKIKLLTAEGS